MTHFLLRFAGFSLLAPFLLVGATTHQILGWNNLGMHCMDSDYSVFSILPPYNTIEAQLLVGGKLVTNAGQYSLTYQAVADPDGSFNSTAMGKGNYYEFASALYGVALPAEAGLAGWSMPGPGNTPQLMLFEGMNHPAPGVATKANWFRAEGIPISPFDDSGRKNYYPLMRLVARDTSGNTLASSDIVLPVSDEMDCRSCHASGRGPAALPKGGWVWSANPERDFRLNILHLHDERQFADHAELYAAALAARGFNSLGLYRGVVADGKPVLCASCHASEALGTASFGDIPALTASVHSKHATVMDPDLGISLDNSLHRAACYRCHPGSTTRCLRGAMGGAVARDGTMAMQCQSCHGGMSQVGSSARVGWFMEPNCQSCHTGNATSNNGLIRYSSAFETNGAVRVALNPLFATQPDTPAPGLSLYRFSAGHGGLQCSACHGSTHAEFPATHRNDNLRNQKIQGHAGVTSECLACHPSVAVNAATASAGPHGMHPVGSAWVNFHHDAVRSAADRRKCAGCHGTDYRGTVLSRAFGPRTLVADLEEATLTVNLFQGALVGCYNCHNGPDSDSLNSSAVPVARNVVTNTTSGTPVSIALPLSGANVTARLISQPAHGSVGLNNAVATYFPDPGYVGSDLFTFAAWDGSKNSALATGTVAVARSPHSIGLRTLVPYEFPAGWRVPFNVVVGLSNSVAAVSYEWDFGDGSPSDPNPTAAHIYQAPGTYAWKVTARADGEVASAQGNLAVGAAVSLRASSGPLPEITWPRSVADAVLERALTLGPDPLPLWSAATDEVQSEAGGFRVQVTRPASREFFRLRQVQ